MTEPTEPASNGLPMFEGREVRNRELQLSGAIAIQAAAEHFQSLEDDLVVIGTFRVNRVAHEEKKDVLTRVEKAAAINLYVVSENVDALDLLQRAQRERDDALDALLGREKLPLEDQDAATDAALERLIDDETGEITDGGSE